MIIDGNEMEKEAMRLSREGRKEEGKALEQQFLAQFREEYAEKDHCSCKAACRTHGNCKECVAIHRAHRDHLPSCFHSLLNEMIRSFSELTEHTLAPEIIDLAGK